MGGKGTRAGDAKSCSGGPPLKAAACLSMLDLLGLSQGAATTVTTATAAVAAMTATVVAAIAAAAVVATAAARPRWWRGRGVVVVMVGAAM